ncbi:MAG: metalloregulator ArsR/SmtB family transcription factor [Thermodesulfobacteriota bacterium]
MKKMSMTDLQKSSESLKAMGHPLRIRIIRILGRELMSVGELAWACETSSPTMSTHLRLLNDRGIVKKQRQGRKVFYRLAAPVYGRIVDCLGSG